MNISYLYNDYLGMIEIVEKNGFITNINIGVIKKENFKESEITIRAKEQLIEYFSLKRKEFNLPLKFNGTKFQNKCWNELLNIPYGKTISYKEEAKNIGNIKAFRAVGNANGRNPIPIIIPCHRVINENGNLGGYTGGIHIKIYLLNLEKEYKTNF